MTPARPAGEAGFTLVELIVALALFGLIATAGLALVEGVLGTRARTDARIERLAEIQRAMFVIDADLEQIAAGPIVEREGVLAFRRHAPAPDGRGATVRYALAGTTLQRAIAGRTQRLLTGVNGVRWSYYIAGKGWRAGWPADPDKPDEWPAAVSADLTLAGNAGTLRRIAELPERP